jgi:hypothetical protein
LGARPKGISSGLRDRFDHDGHKVFWRMWHSSQNSDLITTNITNPFMMITERRCPIKALHYWKVSGSPTTLGTTMQTSCTKEAPSSANHNNYPTGCTTRVPYNYYTHMTPNLITYNFLVLDLPCRRTMVTQVQTLLQTLLVCPQHPLLLLV